jgi:transketolase
MTMLNKTQIEEIAKRVRINIVKMVNEAKSGHIGGSLSGVEILTTLYFNEMNINQDNVKDLERDKFVLSKGHASPLLFAVHAEKGFIPQEELMTFRKINSRLQGTSEYELCGFCRYVDRITGTGNFCCGGYGFVV